MNFNGYEAVAITIVSKVSPWLTPIPTAWLVYDRTMLHLHWPRWVAICAGVTLELLGVAILSTALALYAYNRKKRKSDPLAPLWLAVVLVAVYLVTALLLVMVLDIAPGIAVYSQALFPVLSLAAFVLLGLRLDHQERVTAIATGKADAKAERARKRAEKAMQEPEPAPLYVDTGTKTMQVPRLAQLHPEGSRARLAQEVGCAASTVTRALTTGEGQE